jgi:hypothetical protein
MTSLSCGVSILLQAAQFLEEQESGQQQQQQQLYRPIVNPPMSTGMYHFLMYVFYSPLK